MTRQRCFLAVFALTLLLAAGAAPAGEKKEAKKKRGGTIVGAVTAKGKGFVEVKADGEERARKYVPHWIGGAPAKGGGPDKKTLKAIDAVKVGDRVRLVWEFEERPRVVRIEVIKGGAKKNDR